MGILVTGGAGFIGSHVALSLLKAGECVAIIDNLSTGYVENIPADARFHRGSVGDVHLVSRIIAEEGVREVVHLAGSLDVPESVADPLHYYSNNVAASASLFEACRRTGVNRIVFSSTAAIYGNPESAEPVSERSPARPISPYARTKLAVEWMLHDAYTAYGLSSITLRYFNVAGADPLARIGPRNPRAQQLMRMVCQTALGMRPSLCIYGGDYPTRDGTGVRDYVHVSDLADAHLAAINALRGELETCAVMNCGYGRGYSVLDVVAEVERVSGRKVQTHLVARRPGDPAESIADNTEIMKRLDWFPRYGRLEDMISHCLAWEGRTPAKSPA